MKIKRRVSLQSIVTLWPDNDTGDMLPQRCPNCDWSEEGAAGAQLRFQMRLQRMARVVAVCLVLLLGMALGTLVLLLFGSPFSSSCGEEPPLLKPIAPEAVSQKQQSGNDLSRQNALFTIEANSQPKWQHGSGNAHLRGNINSNGRNITVPTGGLYRLYLQVTFNFNSNDHRNLCLHDLLTMQITVEDYSESYMEFKPLLMSKDAMSCLQDWTKSMYTAGTFRLEDDTKVRVEINHSKLIDTNEQFTFLGIDLISA